MPHDVAFERQFADWNREMFPSGLMPIGVGGSNGSYCKNCMFYCIDAEKLIEHIETCHGKRTPEHGSGPDDTDPHVPHENREEEQLPVIDPLRPFRCSRCGRSYQLAQSLQRHRWKCDKSRPMPCTICGIVYYRADNLQNHLKSAHKCSSHLIL
ncbi:hypothetical protein ACOMHN_036027 [Nucella lapillus]